jgi:hypothetical protein
MTAEMLIAIALLCGQPTRGTMSYYNLTADEMKQGCQKSLVRCVRLKTTTSVGRLKVTPDILADCYEARP